MSETFTMRIPICTCAICGKRDWRGMVKVMNAKGTYCEACADIAAMHARRIRATQSAKLMGDLMRGGPVVILRTPDWDPRDVFPEPTIWEGMTP